MNTNFYGLWFSPTENRTQLSVSVADALSTRPLIGKSVWKFHSVFVAVFNQLDLVSYEEVVKCPTFNRKTLVLIGKAVILPMIVIFVLMFNNNVCIAQ